MMAVAPLEFGHESFSQFSNRIFRVEAQQGGKTYSGTGFAIARVSTTDCLILATAKHVIDFPDSETVTWNVKQVDNYARVEREMTFSTNSTVTGATPFLSHKWLDVATFTLPSKRADGNLFSAATELPLPLIENELALTPGTRVGWAGFPGTVGARIKKPQLCYFEGVISAAADFEGRCLYIVDGHNSQGASGGPVWHYSTERERFEIVGIISSYLLGKSGVPGFCVFESINSLAKFLHADAKARPELGIEFGN